jgi:hypothetical protein
MITTIAFVAALSLAPHDAGELAVRDVRATYGIIGPKRPAEGVLPGDSVFLTFDIDGITADADGKIRYSVATEVKDAKGKTHYSQPGRELEAIAALGGNQLPAYAQIEIGLQQPPGDYTMKLTVSDLASKKSTSISHNFKVLPKEFGIVRLATSSDPEGRHPAGLPLGVGQSLWINLAAVGFQRGGQGQPNVAFTLRILDEAGKPTLSKPFAGAINQGVTAQAPALPVQFHVGLNRAGNFTIEITAKDEIGGKMAKKSFPITVSAAK